MITYYFAISATFRNERPYLKEWIDFHLKRGVDVILLYDDRSTDNPLELLAPYIKNGKIIYHKSNKYVKRFPHIKGVLENYKNRIKWVAFIDIDEFLYPTKSESIKKILKEFDQHGHKAIHVNWLSFGSNNLDKAGDRSVLHRFTKRAEKLFGLNSEVKSIVQPEFVINMITNSHILPLKDGVKYVDDKGESGRIGNHNFTINQHITNYFRSYNIPLNQCGNRMGNKVYPPSYNRLCINHYLVKSKEEYLEKAERYDNKRNDRYNLTTFNRLNKHLNDVEDETILALA